MIGRMHVVGSHDSELFYLRRLLCVVRGATSFGDLKTFMDVTYHTFKETCAARGMLLDDNEYIAAVQDMCNTICSVDELRRQFACLLVHCRPTNGITIFEMFKPELCGCDESQLSDEQCTLWALEAYCNELGRTLHEFGFQLPEVQMLINYPENYHELHCHNRDVAYSRFSNEQHAAAAQIYQAIAAGHGGIFYIQASGGCGKTFWANGVCAALRAEGIVPVVVAASALAATILNGGRTAHSVFGIPIHVDESSWCMSEPAARSDVVNSPVVFWDECSMVHVDVANCVNRSLRDWMGNTALFGGKVVVFMGDFQQLLPVVRGGSGEKATLMTADWWNKVQILHFTQNYRSNVCDYCELLAKVGKGELAGVVVPKFCVTDDVDVFCERVFGDMSESGRHVVTLTLQDAASINSRVIAKLPGTCIAAAAADVKINCKDPELYSDEFLHSLHISGVPPAVLELKVGARWRVQLFTKHDK